jgi:hypothetical protein
MEFTGIVFAIRPDGLGVLVRARAGALHRDVACPSNGRLAVGDVVKVHVRRLRSHTPQLGYIISHKPQ